MDTALEAHEPHDGEPQAPLPVDGEPQAPSLTLTRDQGDRLYLESQITEALVGVHESVLALATWEEGKTTMSRLESAIATVTIAVHDTLPLVTWDASRTKAKRHWQVRKLTERLHKRIQDSGVLTAPEGDITSEDDPRVTSTIKDVLAYMKSVHVLMGKYPSIQKEQAAKALQG